MFLDHPHRKNHRKGTMSCLQPPLSDGGMGTTASGGFRTYDFHVGMGDDHPSTEPMIHQPMVALTYPEIALLWPGEYDENSCFRRDWTCGMFVFEPDWTVKLLLRFSFCIIVRLCMCMRSKPFIATCSFVDRSLFVCLWYMEVSWNGCTAKWMVYKGRSYENGWFGGTPILGNIHNVIYICIYLYIYIYLRVSIFHVPYLLVLLMVIRYYVLLFIWFLMVLLIHIFICLAQCIVPRENNTRNHHCHRS